MSKRLNSGAAWLLSFSDLLTLILCFFLILVAGPISKNGETGKNLKAVQIEGIAAKDQPARTASQSHMKAGTMFAKLPSKVLEYDIPLSLSDIDPESSQLKPDWLKELKSSVSIEGYELNSVKLAICARENMGSEADAWFKSTGRILAIRSQLIDAGLYRGKAELAPLGPNCGAIEKQAGKGSFEGMLHFTLQRVPKPE